MTPETGGSAGRDYLWDPATAPANPDVEALVRRLRPLQFDSRALPLVLPAPLRQRTWWPRPVLAIAASLAVAAIAVASLWSWRENWPSGRAWPITRTSSDSGPWPRSLEIDRPFELQAPAPVRVDIARIGEMVVEPGSALTLTETSSSRHRVALDRGTVNVRVWAPPSRFAIQTPAGLVVDLGCIFDLDVDHAGTASLHVSTGWVQLANDWGDTLVPAGASANMTRDVRPNVPLYDDAPSAFKASVRSFERAPDAALRTSLLADITRAARARDVVTLLVLANQSPADLRRPLLERAAALWPPPPDLTIDQILADRDKLWTWYNTLELPPAKSWWRNWRDAFPRPRR